MNYTFNKEFACKYGVEEAILINHFQWWLAKNKANKKNEFIDHTWTYNSNDAFVKLFPFWTDKQIHRILKSLIRQKVLITGNYNKSSYDRTLWYAFSDESIFLNGEIHLPKRENGFTQTGTPIPVNIPSNIPVIEPVILDTTSCDSQKSEPLPQFEKSDSTKTNDPPETVGAAAPPKTGKKEPFKQPKTKPKPEPLHVPCKKIFMDFFKNQSGIEYYWRGRDGKAINEIIKQLRGRGTGDPEIPDVFKTILNKIEDKWMLSNLDVSLLNSKFNQVITKIKNENKQLTYDDIKAEFKRRAEQGR